VSEHLGIRRKDKARKTKGDEEERKEKKKENYIFMMYIFKGIVESATQ